MISRLQRMGTTLPPLPWEILAYILTFLPPRYLLPVILTCHALRNLGEPLLYSHISLSNCPIRSLYLFRTLLAREELCKHVLTFHPADDGPRLKKHLDTLLRVVSRRIRSGDRATLLRHTAQVLGRIRHVENISIPGSTPEILLSIALSSQIKKFRSPRNWGVRELRDFLDILLDVTHLELPFDWYFSEDQLQIQPHNARCLEGLLCSTYIATILVPLRPIKQLFLVWEWRSTELLGLSSVELMEVMAQSTEAIKSLGLFFGYRANTQTEITGVFTATAKFLPDVEELTIWVKFWKDNTHGLTWSLRELSESLSSFRKLCTLDFNGSMGWGEPYFDHRRNAISTVYTRILQDWSERCPTLEKVTFPNGMIWIKEPVLIRSKSSKYWPLPFFRTTFPSVPRQRTNAMVQGVEDAPSMDIIPGDTPGSDSIFTQGDLLGHTSNIEITTAANLPSPKPAAHSDLNQTTSTVGYRWRCLNQYLPRSDRASQPSQTRIQRSEFGWGEPMFKRDLKGGWPEGLPTGTSG